MTLYCKEFYLANLKLIIIKNLWDIRFSRRWGWRCCPEFLAPCRLVSAVDLSPEDVDSVFPRNAGFYRRVYTVPKPRRTWLSCKVICPRNREVCSCWINSDIKQYRNMLKLLAFCDKRVSKYTECWREIVTVFRRVLCKICHTSRSALCITKLVRVFRP
jgi:hypothetical protein